LQDGTFNLILCRRFEKENEGFMPNFPKKSFYPLSLGGLTTKATQFCKMHNITTTTKIKHYFGTLHIPIKVVNICFGKSAPLHSRNNCQLSTTFEGCHYF